MAATKGLQNTLSRSDAQTTLNAGCSGVQMQKAILSLTIANTHHQVALSAAVQHLLARTGSESATGTALASGSNKPLSAGIIRDPSPRAVRSAPTISASVGLARHCCDFSLCVVQSADTQATVLLAPVAFMHSAVKTKGRKISSSPVASSSSNNSPCELSDEDEDGAHPAAWMFTAAGLEFRDRYMLQQRLTASAGMQCSSLRVLLVEPLNVCSSHGSSRRAQLVPQCMHVRTKHSLMVHLSVSAIVYRSISFGTKATLCEKTRLRALVSVLNAALKDDSRRLPGLRAKGAVAALLAALDEHSKEFSEDLLLAGSGFDRDTIR